MESVNRRVVHGAFDYGELEALEVRAEEVVDFSVNSNPYGPSPQVGEALGRVVVERYPDRECLALRRAIVEEDVVGRGIGLDMVLCGNGTAELIWSIARAFLQRGQKAGVIGPTFGEYRTACEAVGARVVEYRARAEERFWVDGGVVERWVEEERPGVVWLCNPNNPTGGWIDEDGIKGIAGVCHRVGAVLVMDEAYWRFLVPRETFSALDLLGRPGMGHVLVLRSLTKDYALAGVRIGYVVGVLEMIEQVRGQVPSWNVSSFAQTAGVAAVRDQEYLRWTLGEVTREREAFLHALQEGGWKVVPSRTHFFLVEVGDARLMRERLLRRRILVRDCRSFGLPGFIRVATRVRREWETLVRALEEER